MHATSRSPGRQPAPRVPRPGRRRGLARSRCAETGPDTATGGRLQRVQQYVDDRHLHASPTATASATSTSTSSLDFHCDHGRIGTVTGVHPTSRYGEMRSPTAPVIEFDEKPTPPRGCVSGGFFVFQREFFDYLDDDPELFFEHEPLQQLARDGELSVFPHDGFWMGMDTYREFTELNRLWATGDAPWKVWELELDRQAVVRELGGRELAARLLEHRVVRRSAGAGG